jgi:hypothetical protein
LKSLWLKFDDKTIRERDPLKQGLKHDKIKTCFRNKLYIISSIPITIYCLLKALQMIKRTYFDTAHKIF